VLLGERIPQRSLTARAAARPAAGAPAVLPGTVIVRIEVRAAAEPVAPAAAARPAP